MTTLSQKLAFQPGTQVNAVGGTRLYAISLTPSQLLLTGGSSGVLHIYDLKRGNVQQTITTGSPITSIQWTIINSRFETFWVGLGDGIVSLYYRKIGWRVAQFGFTPFILAVQSSIEGPIEDISAHQRDILITGGRSISLLNVSIRSRFFSVHPIVTLQSMPILLFPFQDDSPPSMRANTVHVSAHKNLMVITFVDSSPLITNTIIALYHRGTFDLYKAIQINRRAGASALSNSARYFAITNLADGIDIFSLPSLDSYGSIAQNIAADNNETISLKFINDDFIAVGGMGGIQIYEVESLRMIGCLQEGFPPTLYRCIAVSLHHNVVAGGAVNGKIAIWEWKTLNAQLPRGSRAASFPPRKVLCTALIVMGAAYLPLLYYLLVLFRSRL